MGQDFSVTVMLIVEIQEIRVDKFADHVGDAASGAPLSIPRRADSQISYAKDLSMPREPEDLSTKVTVPHERCGYFKVSRTETDPKTRVRANIEGGIESKPLSEKLKALRDFSELQEILII